jgi:hypothetical protein
MEVVVKCRVARDEVEDTVIRLRSGERLVRVPDGLNCKDAFDCYESADPAVAVLRVGYGR